MATQYRATATLADDHGFIIVLCDSALEALVEGTRLKARGDVLEVKVEALEPREEVVVEDPAQGEELQEILEGQGREVRIYYRPGATRQWRIVRWLDGRRLVDFRLKGQDAAWDYALRFVGLA